jgi:CubicO group peptidase (beta-lactamase class C family)
MGIKNFAWQENGLGQAHKSGGLSLTTHGLAKFAEVQRNDGMYNGKKILSSEWTTEAIKPRAVIRAEEEIEYGYLWWLAPQTISGKRFKSYFMTGNGGNRVMVLPAHNLTIVVTKTDYNQRNMHQKTNALIENEIIARLN